MGIPGYPVVFCSGCGFVLAAGELIWGRCSHCDRRLYVNAEYAGPRNWNQEKNSLDMGEQREVAGLPNG